MDTLAPSFEAVKAAKRILERKPDGSRANLQIRATARNVIHRHIVAFREFVQKNPGTVVAKLAETDIQLCETIINESVFAEQA